MAILGFVFLSEYDVDDDRRSHKRSNGIEGDDARIAREYGDDVAEHRHGCSGEDGGRHERLMIVGVENHACDVRDRESDETDRSTKGGGDGREQTSDEQEVVAEQLGVDPEVAGVFLT